MTINKTKIITKDQLFDFVEKRSGVARNKFVSIQREDEWDIESLIIHTEEDYIEIEAEEIANYFLEANSFVIRITINPKLGFWRRFFHLFFHLVEYTVNELCDIQIKYMYDPNE